MLTCHLEQPTFKVKCSTWYYNQKRKTKPGSR